MDMARPPTGMCCAVVHANPIVSEDLRDFLARAGASEVHVLADLNAAVAIGPALVFVEGAPAALSASPAAARLMAQGGHVVVLSTHESTALSAPGLHVIGQPFTDTDLVEVLAAMHPG